MQAGEEDAHDGGDQSPEVPDQHCPSQTRPAPALSAAPYPKPQKTLSIDGTLR
jgi:hypothetical protein